MNAIFCVALPCMIRLFYKKEVNRRKQAMLGSIFALLLTIANIILLLSIRLRLWPLLIYILLMVTAFADWAKANELLALVFMGVIIAGIIASWIRTAVNYFRAY